MVLVSDCTFTCLTKGTSTGTFLFHFQYLKWLLGVTSQFLRVWTHPELLHQSHPLLFQFKCEQTSLYSKGRRLSKMFVKHLRSYRTLCFIIPGKLGKHFLRIQVSPMVSSAGLTPFSGSPCVDSPTAANNKLWALTCFVALGKKNRLFPPKNELSSSSSYFSSSRNPNGSQMEWLLKCTLFCLSQKSISESTDSAPWWSLPWPYWAASSFLTIVLLVLALVTLTTNMVLNLDYNLAPTS